MSESYTAALRKMSIYLNSEFIQFPMTVKQMRGWNGYSFVSKYVRVCFCDVTEGERKKQTTVVSLTLI